MCAMRMARWIHAERLTQLKPPPCVPPLACGLARNRIRMPSGAGPIGMACAPSRQSIAISLISGPALNVPAPGIGRAMKRNNAMYTDIHGKKISCSVYKGAVRFGRVYLYRSNSNRWYVMRGKQMIFGHGGVPATLADCQRWLMETKLETKVNK